jgi:MHS family proline/betaine transporter-like MFS transporter
MAIQIFTVAFGFMGLPAMPAFYRHLPIFKRFTYASFMYALSRAVIYIATTFGLVSITNYLGHWGILVIVVPIGISFIFALQHFVNLEKEANYYPQKVYETLGLKQE